MQEQKLYELTVKWTGNSGEGTINPDSYKNDYQLVRPGQSSFLASFAVNYNDSVSGYIPEELLIASLSSLNMLAYLRLCAAEGIIVMGYIDHAGLKVEISTFGIAHIVHAVLQPHILVMKKGMLKRAAELYEVASSFCMISNACNFQVIHRATFDDLHQSFQHAIL